MSTQVSDKILLRVYALLGVTTLFGIIILVRVFMIQFGGEKDWMKRVEGERLVTRTVQAARGNILAEDGQVLATSQPFFRIAIDPSRIKTSEYENFDASLDSLAKNLSERFGGPDQGPNFYKDKVTRAMADTVRYLFLTSRKVDFKEYSEMRTWPIFRNSRLKGGLIEEVIKNKRFYPLDSMARITLGLMKDDSIGIKGIEYAFENDLKGDDGQVLMRKIAGNLEVPEEDFSSLEAEDGADVVTTLDVDMQDIVETTLARTVRTHNANYGVAVLMEVETGEIKAMANYPENYNYAIAQRNEPGSTFKLATAIAALEAGVVKPTDSFYTGNGTKMFYGEEMKDHVALGTITFQEAFSHSSNVAMATVIDENFKSQPEKFIAKLEEMGLSKPVNSQIPGEPEPIFIRPNDRLWNSTTLPWMAIGYNLKLTPLQTVTFYNAIANDGRMVAPFLVKEVRRGGKAVRQFETEVLNKRICSQSTVKSVQAMMDSVGTSGTAGPTFRGSKLKMAGKTGTTLKVEGASYQKKYQASFCGYFPADKPKYTLFILVDEPKGGDYYGSSVAAPAFREIAEQIWAMDPDFARTFAVLANDSVRRPVTRKVNQENAEAVYSSLQIKTPT